jgi:type II secretory pathway pseudopilin PulG
MHRSSQIGFTLIETMVVGIMVTILGTLVIPQIQGTLSAYRLTASANLVADELNAGWALAVSTGSVHVVTVDGVDETIQITDPNDAANLPRTEKPLQEGSSFTSWDPIRFYSRGLVDGGDIVIQDNFSNSLTITITAGGEITIN